ncbi:MAG: response regulator transcription factor [Dehalococcoidales bacterium]|nr:response regulator transcription factor [Dehalococcoidales bacterium]
MGNRTKENEPLNPNESRSMKKLHQRVKSRAASLRWNLNGLMVVYAFLIIVIILSFSAVNSMFVAVIAVAGLVAIWFVSSLRIKKIEEELYRQEIIDYGELLNQAEQLPKDLFPASHNQSVSPLSRRELEVLVLIGSGRRNKAIARELHISEMTVKNHISHIFEKMGVDDRIGAVILAIQNGWLKYDDLKKIEIKAGDEEPE